MTETLRLSESYFFLDLQVRALEFAQLWPAVLVICVLLAHAVYTDTFHGWIIKNSTALALFCAAAAITPLLFADLDRHLIFAAVTFAVIFVLALVTGGIGMGDVKLYAGLFLLAGPAAPALFMLSVVSVLAYALPTRVVGRVRARLRDGEWEGKGFGNRLGHVPAAPGIALAVPLTALAYGVDARYVVAAIAVEALMVGLFAANNVLEERVAAKEAAKASDEAQLAADGADEN